MENREESKRLVPGPGCRLHSRVRGRTRPPSRQRLPDPGRAGSRASLLPARPLFSLLPAAVVSRAGESSLRCPSERAGGGEGGAAGAGVVGPGSLGWSRGRPQPKSATLAGPTLRPCGRRRCPSDAQKPPDAEPSLCPILLTSRGWHGAAHLWVQR